MRKNFSDFVKAVDLETKKAEENFKKAKKAAEKIAASAAASPSQAGDRFHSQGTADIAKQKYEAVLALKDELKQKGESVCFKYKKENVFVVDNPILISGFKIISSRSPLGKKILGQK